MTRARTFLRCAPAVIALAGAATISTQPLGAQIMGSEEATFSQVIDGTTISVRYARPSRRGRSVLFGEQMPWGERWTPGANTSTTFRASKDIELDGYPVAAGAYSVWLDLVEDGPWQLVLDPDTTLFHMYPPPDSDTQVRFAVTPREAPELETLLWSMDSIRATGGLLRMHWGTTLVSMKVKVPPSQRLAVTTDEAGPVLGQWEGTEPAPEPGAEPGAFTFEVTWDETSGFLRGVMRHAAGVPDWHFLLLPAADGVFQLGWEEDGELWEVLPTFAEFSGGGAGGYEHFEVRDGESDAVLWSGDRATGRKGG